MSTQRCPICFQPVETQFKGAIIYHLACLKKEFVARRKKVKVHRGQEKGKACVHPSGTHGP